MTGRAAEYGPVPPVIRYGHAAPGEALIDGASTTWRGSPEWFATHGKARSFWRYGLLVSVSDVSDGTPVRRDDIFRHDAAGEIWCRKLEDGSYRLGRLEMDAGDIVFLEDPSLPASPAFPEGSMGKALIGSAQLRTAVAHPMAALRLYGTLCEALWQNVVTGDEARFRWRRAAEAVCAVRGLREPSSEFLCEGGEGERDPEMLKIVESLGWRCLRDLGSPELKLDRAARLVSECRSREPTATPAWYAAWITRLPHDDIGLISQISNAAYSGKVTLEEWDLFWECVSS